MTILFADGFEDGLDTEYAATGGITIGATNGRRGGKAIQPASWQSLNIGFPGASTLFVHFALKMPVLGGSSFEFARFKNAADTHIQLYCTPAGALEVWRPGVQLGASSAGTIPLGAYTSYECKITIHDSTGSVEIRLNGSSTATINLTNVDTRNGTSTTIDTFMPYNTTGDSNFWVDDVVIWDTNGSVNNTWMGDLRVDSYMPTADGDTVSLTPSTGTDHYALVDEVPASGTDYNQSGTLNNKDLYQLANMSHNPTAIKAVIPFAKLLKDDAGTRSGALLIKSGGTETAGSDIALSTSALKYLRVVETNPNGGGAWDKTAVDAVQVGVKVSV